MIRDKIDSFHLEDIKNEIHPSVFFKHANYDLFILRLPQLEENKMVVKSNAFVITDETYYFYDKAKESFVDLKDIKGFYRFLDHNIDSTLKIILNYFNKIEAIEDKFYDGKLIKDFNQQWFGFKNDIVRTNRVLFKAVETIEDLISNYKKEDDYLERNFEDIEEHIKRAYRNSGFLLEKLDALYNFYITQNNEQMNHTIYILTLLSGVFLPLNLLVGFFGMNTTSLPFTIGDGGTYKVISLLLSVAFITTLLTYFLKKR